MKLYEIQLPARVFVTASDGSTYIDVDHLDGMYSFCRTEKGAIVHLAASADLVPTAEGYVLS